MKINFSLLDYNVLLVMEMII